MQRIIFHDPSRRQGRDGLRPRCGSSVLESKLLSGRTTLAGTVGRRLPADSVPVPAGKSTGAWLGAAAVTAGGTRRGPARCCASSFFCAGVSDWYASHFAFRSSACTALLSEKLRRARVRSEGLKPAQLDMRLCNSACSGAGSLGKFLDSAIHFRFCALLSETQLSARGCSAACCPAESSCQASPASGPGRTTAAGIPVVAVPANFVAWAFAMEQANNSASSAIRTQAAVPASGMDLFMNAGQSDTARVAGQRRARAGQRRTSETAGIRCRRRQRGADRRSAEPCRPPPIRRPAGHPARTGR